MTSHHVTQCNQNLKKPEITRHETLSQVRRSDIPGRNGGLLAVSQSGETKDVHRAVKLGEEKVRNKVAQVKE